MVKLGFFLSEYSHYYDYHLEMVLVTTNNTTNNVHEHTQTNKFASVLYSLYSLWQIIWYDIILYYIILYYAVNKAIAAVGWCCCWVGLIDWLQSHKLSISVSLSSSAYIELSNWFCTTDFHWIYMCVALTFVADLLLYTKRTLPLTIEMEHNVTTNHTYCCMLYVYMHTHNHNKWVRETM